MEDIKMISEFIFNLNVYLTDKKTMNLLFQKYSIIILILFIALDKIFYKNLNPFYNKVHLQNLL